MNHSETHNINLLAGQGIVGVLQAEPENKTLGKWHGTNRWQGNTLGAEENENKLVCQPVPGKWRREG